LVFIGQKVRVKPPGVELAGCAPVRSDATAKYGNIADIIRNPVLLFGLVDPPVEACAAATRVDLDWCSLLPSLLLSDNVAMTHRRQ